MKPVFLFSIIPNKFIEDKSRDDQHWWPWNLKRHLHFFQKVTSYYLKLVCKCIEIVINKTVDSGLKL